MPNATTPFWQSRDFIRTRAHTLLTAYFGEKPSFNVSLVIAQVVNDSSTIIDKDYPEKEVWLHEKIFKILAALLDRNHELINGKPGSLSKELERLGSLEAKVYSLRENLNVVKIEEQLNKISREALQAS